MQQFEYTTRRPSALEELHRAAPPMDPQRSTLPSPSWSDATMCPTCGQAIPFDPRLSGLLDHIEILYINLHSLKQAIEDATL
jgi:hypothetical protein